MCIANATVYFLWYMNDLENNITITICNCSGSNEETGSINYHKFYGLRDVRVRHRETLMRFREKLMLKWVPS